MVSSSYLLGNENNQIGKENFTYEESLEKCLEYFDGDELASKVFLDKYALRDNNQNLLEQIPADMHRRIAKEFARIEKKKFKKPLSFDKIFSYLDHFNKIIPQGSPLYGIGNNFQTISLSNCFVVPSPTDSYGGIARADEHLLQISKRRGGTGMDVSHLRPNGSPTNNASRRSTGIIPFMERFSNSIREVGQDGRRGALMLTISIHHPEAVIPLADGVKPEPIVVKNGDAPDIETTTEFYNPNRLDFATVKYDRKRVTGANISIRLTDEFLDAVEKGEKFEQRWPVDAREKGEEPVFSQWIDARKAWKKIVRSAWQMAEPGLLFWDNIITESPADCYADVGYRTICTNPCSELPLSALDSCRLLLLNLLSYVKNPFTGKSYFDFDEFYKDAQVAQRLMDDLVDLELEKIDAIIKKIKSDPEDAGIKRTELEMWNNVRKACSNGRRTGTGITALGDTIAAVGMKYGSNKSIEFTEKIYKTLKLGSYRSSVDMAKELGAFSVWDWEKEKKNPFLLRIKEEDVQLWKDMKEYGRRNIANLTTAPAGSVSIESQTTSGIEPLFMIFFIRKKKINPSDQNSRTDSIDQSGDHWQHFRVFHPQVKTWMKVKGIDESKMSDQELEEVIKKSPWYGCCAEDINWKQRVKLQAAATKHVDHAISSTLNLPADVAEERVAEIYETAWKAGCKGITVYRTGCRTGVLVDANSCDGEKIAKTDAPKRPKRLPCSVHHQKVMGEDYFVIIGHLPNDGEPYEVFAGKNGFIANKVTTGIIEKVKRGHYRAEFNDGSTVENISEYVDQDQEMLTRLASTALRHGVDVNFIVHQLEKAKGDLTSFGKAISRALKRYIKNGAKVTGEMCPQCSGANLHRQEGCMTCKDCGYSKCG